MSYKISSFFRFFEDWSYCQNPANLAWLNTCFKLLEKSFVIRNSCLFNLHPEKWFEGHPLKSTLSNLPCKIYPIKFTVVKSNNLQYNTLVPWFAGTNDQVSDVYFFQNFLQNSWQKRVQCIFFLILLWIYINKSKEF